jgi:hypothetical protein
VRNCTHGCRIFGYSTWRKAQTEKIMGKHVSQSTRTVKDKLDNRLSKGKEIKKESTELNEEDLGQVTGGGGWNLAQNKRSA